MLARVTLVPEVYLYYGIVCSLAIGAIIAIIASHIYDITAANCDVYDTYIKYIYGWLLEFYVRATCLLYCLISLSSYQDRYRFVIVHTHGDFIMLPNWKTRLSTPRSDIPLSYSILILN